MCIAPRVPGGCCDHASPHTSHLQHRLSRHRTATCPACPSTCQECGQTRRQALESRACNQNFSIQYCYVDRLTGCPTSSFCGLCSTPAGDRYPPVCLLLCGVVQCQEARDLPVGLNALPGSDGQVPVVQHTTARHGTSRKDTVNTGHSLHGKQLEVELDCAHSTVDVTGQECTTLCEGAQGASTIAWMLRASYLEGHTASQ